MQKTKIEWTDYTWNPIKGLCPVDCKLPDGQSYCYARQMYQRFKWKPKMDFELHNPTAIDRLHRKNIPNGSKVFVCSTFELFHPKVPKSWRRHIFNVINYNSKISFQILTKFPQNIDRPMPDNMWLGATITCRDELHRILKIKKTEAKIKFISFEPILGNLPIWWGALKGIDWIIIGKLTGFGRKYDASSHIFKRRTAQILLEAKRHNIPVFLKNNLKEIWGEPLIQEYPNIAEESIYQQNINS